MKRGGCGFVSDDRLLAEKHLLELHNIGFYLWEIRMKFAQDSATCPSITSSARWPSATMSSSISRNLSRVILV